MVVEEKRGLRTWHVWLIVEVVTIGAILLYFWLR